MRPFKRRSASRAVQPATTDQQLRPAQLENTMRYGWPDLSHDTVREEMRKALGAESESESESEPDSESESTSEQSDD